MAYQSKHTGAAIDNAIAEHPDIEQQIIDINSQLSQLNKLINNLNTSIGNLQDKDISLTNSINNINTTLQNHTHPNKIQMPNYSSVITSKTGTSGAWSYTATENCYVYITVSHNSSTKYTIKINDVNITASNIYSKTGLFLLAKGDKIACSADNNGWSYWAFRIKYI